MFSFDERNIELENKMLYSWCWRSLHYWNPSTEVSGKGLKVHCENHPKYAQEVFDHDGYCALCVHRDNPIDKCNMGWDDSKYGKYYGWERDIGKMSGINRTGLIFAKQRYLNGQHCKGFEIDREVMFSKKNDYTKFNQYEEEKNE